MTFFQMGISLPILSTPTRASFCNQRWPLYITPLCRCERNLIF
jgi:hypothetical protein